MGEKEPQSEADELVHYSEPARGVYKKLIIRNGRLAGAILLGDGMDTPNVLQAFDRGEELPASRAGLLFPGTGGMPQLNVADLPPHGQICNCNGVTKSKIFEAAENGSRTLKEVCAATRAGTGCGACKAQVQAVLDYAEKTTLPQPIVTNNGNGKGGPTVVAGREENREVPTEVLPIPLEAVLAAQN